MSANFLSFLCVFVIFGVLGQVILALPPGRFWWQAMLDFARRLRRLKKVEDVEGEVGVDSGQGD